MPLDESSRRFAFLLQRDLRRISELRETHAARGDVVAYDSVARLATFETKSGEVVARLYGELLATYVVRDRILRWAWAGRPSNASPMHGDTIFREGQARGVPQLAMSVVGDLDDEDARTLAKLGALVARAEDVHVREAGGELQFYGLFETPRPSGESGATSSGGDRFSVPPPPVAADPTPPTPAPRAYRSLPPIKEIFEPRGRSAPPPAAAPAVREPARAVFVPVASAAVAAVARACPGFRQALFAVVIDAEPERATDKRRIVVQLVALDADGLLRALDPPGDLVDAAARMVDADRRDGNGAWRKLSARITPKPNGGATLHVDVA